jgi:mycofactocin system creatininase family protein
MWWYHPVLSDGSASTERHWTAMGYDLAWPDVPPRAVLLIPTGSYEQHGPHLPLHTDTTIAVAVAQRAGHALSETVPVVVAPPLAFGASGEHQHFPGTVSIGTVALRAVLVEMVRSASTWASRTVFVNGHGGNVAALGSAVALLRHEGHDAGWVPCGVAGGDAHAGHTETSLMVHLSPHEVRMDRAAAGNTQPLQLLMPALVSGGVRAVSPTGVLGDPRGATAEAGASILESIVDDVVSRIRCGAVEADGCLARLEKWVAERVEQRPEERVGERRR